MKKLITSLLICFTITTSFAQEGFEGKVIYDMEFSGANVTPQIASMLPKESVVYIKGYMSRVEVNAAMSEITVIGNTKEMLVTTMMNVMGKKFAFEVDSTLINEGLAKLGKYEVKYLDESKDIKGYNCKKALIITNLEGAADTTSIWYTKELPVIITAQAQSIPHIDGFTMESNTTKNGMDISTKVREISEQTVDDSLFAIPEGYEMIDKDELKSKLTGG